VIVCPRLAFIVPLRRVIPVAPVIIVSAELVLSVTTKVSPLTSVTLKVASGVEPAPAARVTVLDEP